MPIPSTKLYLSSVLSSSGGYRLLPAAPGDFALGGNSWVSGIADLNGDLIPEIITGSAADDDKFTDAGRIFINYGQSVGGTTSYVDDPLTKITIDGVNAGDLAGATVGTVSNLNGDGIAEILVGAPAMENGVATDAGAAFVLWGVPAGGSIDLNDPFSGDGKGYVIKGEAAGDNAGITLTSIGDLNGDGKAEILVGATGNDAANTDAGAAYVVWGKSSNSIVNLTNVATGTGGFRILGEGHNDNAGSALNSIADLNGDGKAEILIGASGNEDGGADAGAAYVVFGKANGTQIDLSNVASGTGGYRILGQAGDEVGTALTSIGDVNGDGMADILVGAAGAGKAYVVYGKSTTSEVLLSDVDAGIGGFSITAEDNGDLANMSVAGGVDFNQDGIKDIVIGASHNSEGGYDAGAAYVVWGGGTGSVDLSLVSQGIGGAKIVGDAGSQTGSSVAILGDMNGDGRSDLLIGSSGAGAESATIVFTPDSWEPDSNIYGTNGDDVMAAGYGTTLHHIGAGDDNVLGLDGNDTISTGDGNDTIEGGTGSDSMTGGSGNDTYIVDDVGDTTIEVAGGGVDTVQAEIDWTLESEIDNLELVGAAHFGTGNALDNTLTGNYGDDTLDGAEGADTMIGGYGNDTYSVDNVGDVVQEDISAGTDTVVTTLDGYVLGDNVERLTLSGLAHHGTGNALANMLTGTASDDFLDGGLGADTMAGGLGDDTYYVDHVSDFISESTGAGVDTAISSVTYTIGGNVEKLTLTGLNINGTGNALDNTITGSEGNNIINGGAGADMMIGGLGDDTYYIDNSGDAVIEADGEGTDTVVTTSDYTLNAGAFVENITLTGAAHHATGNEKTNTLTGTSGADVLDGGLGIDTLVGGAGDDTYVIDNVGDVITEGAAAGTDSVEAYADYTLGSDLENLTLKGSAHTGTGNALDNKLMGGSGDDILNGLDGNDTLDGGLGADIMTGGAGDDTYYIDNAGDVIVEDVGGGTDTVIVNADYVLTNANIESVHVVGTGHSVTGSVGNNTLSGSSGDDTLDGGDGDDLEVGGDGDDKLISGSGHDSLSGGAGDDTYVVKGGHVEIEDFLGHDTLDASEAEGDSYIDLSGDDVSHIEDQDCNLGQGGSTLAPLDVQFLQDLSGSFGDDIANVRNLVPQIVAALQTVQSNSQFGSSTFVDKAVNPFGASGEWVYDTLLSQTTNAAALTNAYNNMVIRYGNDEPEAQLESLMQLALHEAEVGFRTDSARFVILFTDAPFHKAGDGVAGGITTPNNGDAIMDGVVPGTGEDYPLVAQVKAALEAANIIPIFAIANNYESVYQGLTAELGRGAVVTLTADSSNVVAAITAGMTAATVTSIEDAKGGAGDDVIKGSDIVNALIGNDGDDILMGRGGDDIISGGIGTDTAEFSGTSEDYSYSVSGDVTTITDMNAVDGDEGKDSLTDVEKLVFANGVVDLVAHTYTGTVNVDTFRAMTNDDWTLAGADGNDLLIGRNGADTINGDIGNDSLYGKNGNDILNGGDGVDMLDGGLNDDTLSGGLGNDTLYGREDNDVLNGNAGDDILNGDAGNDILNGNEGADTLDGGLGDDTMAGGTSNDTYVVDSTLDVVSEAANEGIDLVKSRINYTLLANLENLTLVEVDTAISGTGNSVSNVINGNSFGNDLHGLDGADIINGLSGDDFIYGDAGDDILDGGDGTDTVEGGSGNDKLLGRAGDDFLYGGDGNDQLDGGTGIDHLEGGAGSDRYTVDDASDVVTEGIGQGTDQVFSYATYSLSDNIEHLSLMDGGSYAGTGNGLVNTINGNNSDNILHGMGGNDTLYGKDGMDTLFGDDGADYLNGGNQTDQLYGGNGNDKLYGGLDNDILTGGQGADYLYGNEGADIFVFDADSMVGGLDNIKDFSLAQGDVIDIEGLLQGYDPVTSAITDFVRISESATHSYVSVDADGAVGGAHWVQVARIDNVLGLTDENNLMATGHLTVS
ncbi:MAG: type I secretion C-terminal target domain-containing protein [Pseudobdellovibrionaceae bacterium]